MALSLTSADVAVDSLNLVVNGFLFFCICILFSDAVDDVADEALEAFNNNPPKRRDGLVVAAAAAEEDDDVAEAASVAITSSLFLDNDVAAKDVDDAAAVDDDDFDAFVTIDCFAIVADDVADDERDVDERDDDDVDLEEPMELLLDATAATCLVC